MTVSERQRRRGLRYVLVMTGCLTVRGTLDYVCARLLQEFGPAALVRMFADHALARQYVVFDDLPPDVGGSGEAVAYLTYEKELTR